MTRFDAVVIGAGLGGLTAGAILARDGRRVLVIERGNSVGGAASSYKAGDLFVEGSLHVTGDPRHRLDPKHSALGRAGVREAVQWIPAGALYQMRGGPLSRPFVLPDDLTAARQALSDRFPHARAGIERLLGEMQQLAAALGDGGLDAVLALAPQYPDWTASLADKLQALFGDDEPVKCAIAGNLSYFHDDPAELWWVPFAMVQGSFLLSGARFVRGGSQRLSSALARAIRQAGGEVLLRRTVSAATIGDGLHGLTHTARDGGDPQTVEVSTIIGNLAPSALAALLPADQAERLAALLPADQAERLAAGDAGRKPSLSLFALTLGLSRPPRDFGIDCYSTQLLPAWMTTLAGYAEGKSLMAEEPGARMPPLAIADYAAIDSGVPSPPYVLSVVGPDLLSNWDTLGAEIYRAKRERWQRALIDHLDATFPGLAGAVVAAAFNTAYSVQQYLNAPEGAVYGFAPLIPDSDAPYRTARTVLPGLYLASAYAGVGGYSGAVQAAEACADLVLRDSVRR